MCIKHIKYQMLCNSKDEDDEDDDADDAAAADDDDDGNESTSRVHVSAKVNPVWMIWMISKI